MAPLTPATKQQTNAELASRSLPQRIRSETLLLGNREVVIEHAGRHYRLCLTSKGKLILMA